MSSSTFYDNENLRRLQKLLPIEARGKPRLLAFLKLKSVETRHTCRLRVINIFRTGSTGGLMCRFFVEGASFKNSYVVPIEQLAFPETFPIARGQKTRRRSRGAFVRL